MGASPKHKYYGEIYFERPINGVGSVKSYSSDNLDDVLARFKADAESCHMKCDAQIYEREKPFGKLEKTRKLTHKEIIGEELTHREKIGIELRNVRIKRGLTIYELGSLCGMVPTTISKIENGKYNVSVDILGKVADALGYRLTFEERR